MLVGLLIFCVITGVITYQAYSDNEEGIDEPGDQLEDTDKEYSPITNIIIANGTEVTLADLSTYQQEDCFFANTKLILSQATNLKDAVEEGKSVAKDTVTVYISRSDEHTSELQSHSESAYVVFSLKTIN